MPNARPMTGTRVSVPFNPEAGKSTSLPPSKPTPMSTSPAPTGSGSCVWSGRCWARPADEANSHAKAQKTAARTHRAGRSREPNDAIVSLCHTRCGYPAAACRAMYALLSNLREVLASDM